MGLTSKKCVACEGGTPPMSEAEVKKYLAELKTPWEVLDGKKLRREFMFKDFKEAMAFVNKVAAIADAEGHYPDMYVSYNRAVIELWTHAIGGFFENDFIVAAKIEKIK